MTSFFFFFFSPNLFSLRPVLVLVLALWLSRLVTVLRQHCGWTDVEHSTIRTVRTYTSS